MLIIKIINFERNKKIYLFLYGIFVRIFEIIPRFVQIAANWVFHFISTTSNTEFAYNDNEKNEEILDNFSWIPRMDEWLTAIMIFGFSVAAPMIPKIPTKARMTPNTMRPAGMVTLNNVWNCNNCFNKIAPTKIKRPPHNYLNVNEWWSLLLSILKMERGISGTKYTE